jgi:hypothetical protein
LFGIATNFSSKGFRTFTWLKPNKSKDENRGEEYLKQDPMRNQDSNISACRHCQNYVPQGRRGGQCRQLGVLVHGAWKACSLAIPPFAPAWSLEDITWQQKAFEVSELELNAIAPEPVLPAYVTKVVPVQDALL